MNEKTTEYPKMVEKMSLEINIPRINERDGPE